MPPDSADLRTHYGAFSTISKTNGGGRRVKPPFYLALFVVSAILIAGLFFFLRVPSPGAARDNPKDGLRYIWIPSGSFQAGCSKFDEDCSPDEKPAHEVSFSRGYWIGQTEVTAGAYRRFITATRRTMPPEATFGDRFLNNGWANPRMPIANVDWNDSAAYCKWIGGSLPTETQWEYAARAGTTSPRYANLAEIAWFGDNAGAHLFDTAKSIQEDEAGNLGRLSRNEDTFHEVALKTPNQFGLYDTLGNVWEWTADWYSEDYYRTSERFDPKGPPNGQARVLRGGSWPNGPSTIRVSVRGRRPPTARSVDTGFRCVW